MHGRRGSGSDVLANDQEGNTARTSLMWEDVYAAMDFEDDYQSTRPFNDSWWEFKGYENYTRYEKVGERYVGESEPDPETGETTSIYEDIYANVWYRDYPLPVNVQSMTFTSRDPNTGAVHSIRDLYRDGYPKGYMSSGNDEEGGSGLTEADTPGYPGRSVYPELGLVDGVMYDWWKMFIYNQAKWMAFESVATPLVNGANVVTTDQWFPRPKSSRPNDDPPHFDMDTFTSLQPDARTYIDVEYELTLVGTVRGTTTTENYTWRQRVVNDHEPWVSVIKNALSGSCSFSNPNGERSDTRPFPADYP